MSERGNFIRALGIAGTSGAGLNSGREAGVCARKIRAPAAANNTNTDNRRSMATSSLPANSTPKDGNRGFRQRVRGRGGDARYSGRKIGLGVAVGSRRVP